MNPFTDGRIRILILMLGWCSNPIPAAAQTSVEGASAIGTPGETKRDGQHDFDFWFGKWTVHNRRLLDPLTGSKTWVEFEGKAVARPVWGGRANMDEYEADSPSGHIEGMTVRTYNGASHEWSIYWANQKDGAFSLPATVGRFQDGRGEFYDQEDFKGRKITVRYVWTVQSRESCQWEQAFSSDAGASWETNWIMTFTREKE